jgi:hypothetical protein
MSYFIKSKFYVKLIIKNLIFSMIFYQIGNMYKCLCNLSELEFIELMNL